MEPRFCSVSPEVIRLLRARIFLPPRDPAVACAMLRASATLFAALLLAVSSHDLLSRAVAAPSRSGPVAITLRVTRSSPLDLEVQGDLADAPRGSIRYLTRRDLLALAQVSYLVSDDANLTGQTRISGVLLEELTKNLAALPGSDMVVALCDDRYRANYPREYISAHHPLLVLLINGQPPERWPKDSEGHGFDMGPYLISHPKFTPRFKVLSHTDEPQIPWGVVRLEFRDEKTVLGAIAPQGPRALQPVVQAGYKIAEQNCFRCHNLGDEGGHKAGRPWTVLATWATASPEYFAAYVRNPKSKSPKAEMPGFPAYDDATVGALISYFQTFSDSAARQNGNLN
jgi:mono/diheme cytochrome c family protein